MPSDQRVKVVELYDERPESWNKMYAGTHWRHRQGEAQRVKMVVRAALDVDEPMFLAPVDIDMAVHQTGQAMDPDNITAKLYIDAIKGWLIDDDTPDHVRSVTTRSIKSKQNKVVLTIRQSGPDVFTECLCCGRIFTSDKKLRDHERVMEGG